jgi:hypothetical protein
LINDLARTSIIAVSFEGISHEFSPLPGIHESTMMLLFQLRQVVLNAPCLNIGEIVTIPFLSFGPGTFYGKDISWPKGILCSNPEISLATLGSGSILKGQLLVQKSNRRCLTLKIGQTLKTSEEIRKYTSERYSTYPWLSIGFRPRPVERVGFQIEPIMPSTTNNEGLIFEILTNGRISPRQALHEASLSLVHKFRAISNLRFTFFQHGKHIDSVKYRQNIRKGIYLTKAKNGYFAKKSEVTDRDFYSIVYQKIFNEKNLFRLDLGNIDLTKIIYSGFRELGCHTLGQVLERLAFEPILFSPFLKKKRLQSLLRIGFFPF